MTQLPGLSNPASAITGPWNGLPSDTARLRTQQAEEAVAGLESMFLSMMLKQLRTSEQGQGLFAGDKSDTLGSMFDQYLGQYLAESGGVGLSAMLRPAVPGADQQELAETIAKQQQTQREVYADVSSKL
jgi:Rod binding domain-containing protein